MSDLLKFTGYDRSLKNAKLCLLSASTTTSETFSAAATFQILAASRT